jgi:ribosomal protein S12 methylthiotransferase
MSSNPLPRVFCATLGCDKNLVDSEALLGRFALAGVQPVNQLEDADIWVLNTCGFIGAARSDSEETLEQLIQLKEGQKLVVCGCWTQEHGESIQERFPEVDVVAGVGQFDKVVAACLGKEPGTETSHRIDAAATDLLPLAGSVSGPIIEPPEAVHYTGLLDRPLLTPPHLAFVKIGEGCNFNCSFCRIPLIRGRQNSRSIAEIAEEVRNLVARGVSEIQLVSQNTSDFGRDTGENLHDLVRTLDGVEGLHTMRLLYLYAGLVTVEDLLRLLEYPTVAPYLDIPIQHASPKLLRAMKRPGDPEAGARFFAALRREHPDLVLRSTALLGFPGEEDEDVAQLADFLAEVEFDHLGTYRYSPEAGTSAVGLTDVVSEEVILDREALIMDLQSEISLRRQQSRLGREYEVIVDRVSRDGEQAEDGTLEIVESLADGGQWREGAGPEVLEALFKDGEVAGPVAWARSYHFGYDLDGVVLLPGEGLNPGQRLPVSFDGVTSYDVWARPRT